MVPHFNSDTGEPEPEKGNGFVALRFVACRDQEQLVSFCFNSCCQEPTGLAPLVEGQSLDGHDAAFFDGRATMCLCGQAMLQALGGADALGHQLLYGTADSSFADTVVACSQLGVDAVRAGSSLHDWGLVKNTDSRNRCQTCSDHPLSCRHVQQLRAPPSDAAAAEEDDLDPQAEAEDAAARLSADAWEAELAKEINFETGAHILHGLSWERIPEQMSDDAVVLATCRGEHHVCQVLASFAGI